MDQRPGAGDSRIFQGKNYCSQLPWMLNPLRCLLEIQRSISSHKGEAEINGLSTTLSLVCLTQWLQSPDFKQCTLLPVADRMCSLLCYNSYKSCVELLCMFPFLGNSWVCTELATGEGLISHKCSLQKVIIFIYYLVWYDFLKPTFPKWWAVSFFQNATVLGFY